MGFIIYFREILNGKYKGMNMIEPQVAALKTSSGSRTHMQLLSIFVGLLSILLV